MGWKLVGLQGWTGPPAETFALESEQTVVFPSRVGGSAIIPGATTAFPLPPNLVLDQRSSPDLYTDASGCVVSLL